MEYYGIYGLTYSIIEYFHQSNVFISMFKKFLLILVFLITTSFGQGYETETYVNWKHSNSGYWISNNGFNVYSDFDFMITRTVYPDNYGYYTFYFWLYSQSYYWDGYRASYTSTNIRNVTVHISEGGGLKLVAYDYSPLGITFYSQYCPSNLVFKSKIKSPLYYIRWGSMSAL